MSRVVALLFDPAGEGVVGRLRTAAAKVLVNRLSAVGVDRVIVSTKAPSLWGGIPVEVEPDPPGPWSFGKRLADLVRRLEPERLFYFSAGSGFLLTEAELGRLATAAPTSEPFAILNNFYSTDFGLIVPPKPEVLSDLARDNPLGIRLWQAGYQCFELPRSAATQLDIDTPGELQLLALWPGLPDELAQALTGLSSERARRIVALLTNPGAELLLLGRVSGDVLALLEREAACRVRALSEERGMEASGRMTEGRVRSLIGSLGQRLTAAELVTVLSKLGDGVVWDTRVLMAHFGQWPPPKERFSSDLLQYEEVKKPFLKDLTHACADSEKPFLLGGHALVSGGMYLAIELAWLGAKDERKIRWRPLPFAG